jgi:hypothetical protein
MTDVVIYSADVSGLRPLVEAWSREADGTPFGVILSVDHVLADMARLVQGPRSILLVLLENGEPAGFMGLRVFPSPTGPQWIAQEHYWFVRPESRGRASLRLLKTARETVKAIPCSHLLLSASTMASEKHDKVCDLYKRLGAKKFETTYILEV